ncbi:MAG: hypothetical protein [Inoviridae sp.]|nr:MAG: hypothetical protein [Inoviridae sp.]
MLLRIVVSLLFRGYVLTVRNNYAFANSFWQMPIITTDYTIISHFRNPADCVSCRVLLVFFPCSVKLCP